MNNVAYCATDWEGLTIPNFRCPVRASKFLKKHGFRRLPADRERVFLKDLHFAYDYARKVRSRLIIDLEVAILSGKDLNLAFNYIKDIIEEPVPGWVHIFKQSPEYLVRYAREILRGPLPAEYEECLIGDFASCFEYAWQVYDGRLPDNLHNYMLVHSMSNSPQTKYRGHKTKLPSFVDFDPARIDSKTYVNFIEWQRKNLHRLVVHYAKMYEVDVSKPINELLWELEHGR